MNILGEDLKQVINESGEPIEIYNHITQSTTDNERLDFKRFWGTRIPFENEYQVLCSLAYDTSINPGDRVKVLSDNTDYIVANMVSEYFEGEVITKESFMYKCNATFISKRKTDKYARDENYQLVNDWDLIVSGEVVSGEIIAGERALCTGSLEYGNKLEDETYARFVHKKRRFLVSNQLDIQIGDRIDVFTKNAIGISGELETWLVEIVEPNRLHGIKMCELGIFPG